VNSENIIHYSVKLVTTNEMEQPSKAESTPLLLTHKIALQLCILQSYVRTTFSHSQPAPSFPSCLNY